MEQSTRSGQAGLPPRRTVWEKVASFIRGVLNKPWLVTFLSILGLKNLVRVLVCPTVERYLHRAAELKSIVEQLTTIHGSVQFNEGQCRLLSKRLTDCVDHADVEILLRKSSGESCKLVLEELCRAAKEAEILVQDCCKQPWVKAAIKLADPKESFFLRIAELERCRTVLDIHIKLHQGVIFPHQVEGFLQEAHIKCERKFVTEIYPEVEIKALEDKDMLVKKLEREKISGSSEDERYMADSMLQRCQKLSPQRHHLFKMSPRMDLVNKMATNVARVATFGDFFARKSYELGEKKKFEEEAEILACHPHPNIVPLICCSVDPRLKRCFLLMELMSEDLDTTITRRMGTAVSEKCPFKLSEAVDILLQVAQVMLYLFQKGVLHRDVKTSNILIRNVLDSDIGKQYLHIKLADFGEAKICTTCCDQTRNKGTTRYMAPELLSVQNRNVEPMDQSKADVFSFGLMVYEVYTGTLPFLEVSTVSGIRDLKATEEKLKQSIVLPSTCPDRLATLIRRCVEFEVSKRPSWSDICKELRHLKWLGLVGEHKS